MKTTAKVFMACFIGAFIGSLVALQLRHNWWWVGMLAGGFTGYLSYEFQQVRLAVPMAFKAARVWKLNPSGSWLFWKAIMLKSVVNYMFSFWLFVVVFIGAFFLDHREWTLFGVVFGLLLITALGGTGITIMFTLILENPRKYLETVEKIEASIKDSLETIHDFSPLNVARESLAVIIWLWTHTPIAAAFIWKLLRIFFILIHSDIRIICGLDSALGAAIGYFCGNAIVGALAGGVLGVFNYKIISQKVLHLDKIKNM